MKIGIAGLGFVGSSMAVLLAQKNEVVVYDPDCVRVQAVLNGDSPVSDEYMSEFMASNDLNLSATSKEELAYGGADFVVVAVPTNYDPDTKRFDTSNIESAVRAIIAINTSCLIVIKSTIPIGYTQQLRVVVGYDNIVFSPEFLREGQSLLDNLYPSRIIMGSKSVQAKEFVSLLKMAAIKEDIPVLFAGSAEAESIKLFANTYLAMRVAFFNELDSFGVNKALVVKDIIEGVSLDPRIGNHYNNPSFGYGGYCLPKDTRQLLANFEGIPQSLMSAIVDSNINRKFFIVSEVLRRAPKTVGVYRLVMKQGSDNFRSSAIQDIMESLSNGGINVCIYEPEITSSDFNGYEVVTEIGKFTSKSDVILANRMSTDLLDYLPKVICRDVFERD